MNRYVACGFILVNLVGMGGRLACENDLLELAATGQADKLEEILRAGSDSNTTDRFGRTALMYAAAGGHEGQEDCAHRCPWSIPLRR